MGCHPTEANANDQVAALYAAGAAEKGDNKMNNEDIKKQYDGCGCPTCKEMNVDCPDCPVCSAKKADMPTTCDCASCTDNCDCGDCTNCGGDITKSQCCPENISKQAPCWDGYVQRGMKPGDNGKMVPNCVPVEKANDLWEDDDTVIYEGNELSKADGYVPPAGVRSAARRAIKFKEDGKANGAGTNVGWTRAHQLANGESLSLSTVKRMYSYFSRHEVDKKGKDWGNTANPSNGYIMWLAWGGDAGFSWSRGIVNRETDKALFANFGRNVGPAETVKDTYKKDSSSTSESLWSFNLKPRSY
jgi:hypothetical protein